MKINVHINFEILCSLQVWVVMSKKTFDAKNFDDTCEKQPFYRLSLPIYILFHYITYCYLEIVFRTPCEHPWVQCHIEFNS
jgi:hypothetical protein